MALPDLIEIVPLDRPVQAEITVPGSKSITNRALVLAALAEGEVTLEGALWSEDTQIMVECLQDLGFMVDVRPDPQEPCNRTITVYGKAGTVPPGGTEAQPLELFVGNAGTAARFLAAFVCLGKGVYRLHGVDRMHERPQGALFNALRELGYGVKAEQGNDRLPAKIFGTGPQFARCSVSIQESSQFASALLLSATIGGWQVSVVDANAEESPYVAMTHKLIEAFPKRGGTFQIEPDASSGSYFIAAMTIEGVEPGQIAEDKQKVVATLIVKPNVTVKNWPRSGWQVDQNFLAKFITIAASPGVFPLVSHAGVALEKSLEKLISTPGESESKSQTDMFKKIKRLEEAQLQSGTSLSRLTDLGDSIMTAIVMSPLAPFPFRFTDLGRLRVQECERVAALRTELTKCGATVVEKGDTLEISPSKLHGAEIETYNDHRMAMCFAILGLKVPGIKIKNPACVKKTFPNFFQKLAAPPPNGLGAEIRDGKTGRALTHDELFAE